MASGRSKTQVTPPTPGSAKTHWSLPMKKYALPIGAGVVVFGVVTAFAASLTVNSDSLAAGNATVAACQDHAHVAYATSGLTVTAATVTFSNGTAGACDTLDAEVTLT